jgi:hypothetical protein
MAPKALRQLIRAGRNYDFTWRYLFNFAPTVSYKFDRNPIAAESGRVLADLNRDGVAITSVDALLGTDSCYNDLRDAVEYLQHDFSERIAEARAEASKLDSSREKSYVLNYLGSRPVLDLNSVFVRFALQQPILQIANAYLGMYTRLRYFNIWHTFSTQAPAREAQFWHRDREDRYMLKVFVNLSDVSPGAGPFTYAPGTNGKGKIRREPGYFLEGHVRRSTDEQMAEVVPESQWVKGIGPQGTIIFADTHGYHKGGLARERDRLLYTCMFVSQACQREVKFERPTKFSFPPNKVQAFALGASLK